MSHVGWDYGDAGDRWDVDPGSLWEVGPHRLACTDLQEREQVDAALAFFGDAPEMVYTDPPWDAGNARSFRTKANAQTPSIETRKVEFGGFIDSVIDVVSLSRGPVFMEMGVKEVERVKQHIGAHGGSVWEVVPITYYRTKPCVLIHASFSPSYMNGPGASIADLTGMDDDHTPLACIERFATRGPVLDVCMGRGLTAVSADKAGKIAWGIELNPRRLAVTIDKLAERGHEPRRVG